MSCIANEFLSGFLSQHHANKSRCSLRGVAVTIMKSKELNFWAKSFPTLTKASLSSQLSSSNQMQKHLFEQSRQNREVQRFLVWLIKTPKVS